MYGSVLVWMICQIIGLDLFPPKSTFSSQNTEYWLFVSTDKAEKAGLRICERYRTMAAQIRAKIGAALPVLGMFESSKIEICWQLFGNRKQKHWSVGRLIVQKHHTQHVWRTSCITRNLCDPILTPGTSSMVLILLYTNIHWPTQIHRNLHPKHLNPEWKCTSNCWT